MKTLFKKKPVAVAILLATALPVLAADHRNDETLPTSIVGDKYYGNARQRIYDLKKDNNVRSINSSFYEDSAQSILGESDKVYSFGDHFADKTHQSLINGMAFIAQFRGNATQYVGIAKEGGFRGASAASLLGKFFEHSAQILGLKGDYLGNPDGNNNARSEYESFADDATQTLYGVSTAHHDSFTGYASQMLYDVAVAQGGKFDSHARQELHDASKSDGDSFEGDASQTLYDQAEARNGTFAGNARQELSGVSHTEGNSFTENSSQTLHGNATASNGKFADQAHQELFGDSQTAGNSFAGDASQKLNDYSAARHGTFADHARQALHDFGLADGNSFADNTSQTLYDNATARNGKFTESASQVLYGSSISDGDSFTGNTSQTLYDKAVARNGTFAAHTRQELNDASQSDGDSFKGNASQALNLSATALNGTFSDYARQELHGASQASGNRFSGDASQTVYDEAAAINGVFTDNARQELHDNGQSDGNSFTGNASQTLYDAATAQNGTFSGRASQALYGTASSAVDSFSGNASQTLYDAASARNDQFAANASQVLNAASKADGMNFTEKASQTIYDASVVQNGKFSGNASQTIYGSGVATGDTFNEHSRQTIISGISRNATFNHSSAFSAEGGSVENATLNDQTSGFVNGTAVLTGKTTVNDAATLHLAANGQTKAEDLLLNKGTLVIDAPDANQDVSSTHVDFLTVNNGAVRFGSANNGKFTALDIHQLDGSGGTLYFNDPHSAVTGNHLTADAISGHYHLSIDDSYSLADRLDLISVSSAGKNNGTYDLINKKGEKIDAIDLHVYVGKLTRDPDHPDDIAIRQDKSTTTRSTDALLGALSSGLFIADGEMQSVRSRRGDLQNAGHDAAGIWGRYLTNDTHVRAAGSAGYRLEQDGVELGGDKLVDVGNDRLALGVFGSYSRNGLKQDRGNTSNVDSWGGGLYATWFGAQGYYVDGVVKYNHFSTSVRSRTETGAGVAGEFEQNGLGASLETGYRFTLPADVFVEPYIRTAYFTAGGQDVKLSNGLDAKADRLQSIRGETGVTAGKRFELGNGLAVSPYATAAVEHEFAKHNDVLMGEEYRFNNDFSGTTGRYGVGVGAQLTHDTSVYAEADYRKGEHVESPVMANAGVRVNF